MFSIFFVMSVAHSQWISVTDNPLTRPLVFSGGATYGDSIYFIGENAHWKKQFQEYRINSNTIIDYGISYLSQTVGSQMIHYSQWQHIFYTHNSGILQVYNLASTNFPNDVSMYNGTDSSGAGSCLAASEHFVFIIGGYQTSTNLNIFSLSDYLWSDGPQMQIDRLDLNCIVAFDDLYAIGANYEKSIEKISINDIYNKQWQLLDDELAEGVSLAGVALYDSIIWVVGGRTDAISPFITDYVYNINTTDASVTLLDERLPYALIAGKGVTIVAHDVLYVFGGQIMDSGGNTMDIVDWMWYNLKEPTTEPTKPPTHHPSEGPTNVPTNNSSATPSLFPSQLPTFAPWIVQISSTEISNFDTKNSNDTPTDDYTEQEFSPNKSESFVFLYIASSVVSICILALCVMCIRAGWKQRKEAMREVSKMNSLSESRKPEKALSDIMNLEQKNLNKQPPIEALSSMNVMQDSIKSESVEHEQHKAMVKTWLADIVRLPQYYALFVENGFENMKFVRDITDISVVKELGIESSADQKRIMYQIELLKQREEAMKHDDECLIENEYEISGEAYHDENVKIANDFVQDVAVDEPQRIQSVSDEHEPNGKNDEFIIQGDDYPRTHGR